MGNENEIPATGELTREQVTAEVTRAAKDATHAQHQNYTRNPTEWSKWADSLYKRIPGASSTPSATPQGASETQNKLVSDGPAVGTMTDADAKVLQQDVAKLVVDRGIDHKATLAEGSRLFAGADGEALLDLLEARTLPGLAPEATKQAHVTLAGYLQDLNKLRTSGASELPNPQEWRASLDAELAKLGIKKSVLADMETHLFAGKPELHKYFVAYLDAMPAPLAAYVLTARALRTLQGLYQSQS